MSHEFHVGQRVVCIEDSRKFPTEQPEFVGLARGRIYTIERIETSTMWYAAGGSDLVLWVDRAKAYWHGIEWPIGCFRFRPIGSQSIELFRAIAQGVTDGRPIVPDKMPAVEIEAAAWPIDVHFFGEF